MSQTPTTDREEAQQTQRYGCRMVKADYARKLEIALRDALSTFTDKDTLVTAERIEAWMEALK
jgi:hypothetical protein